MKSIIHLLPFAFLLAQVSLGDCTPPPTTNPTILTALGNIEGTLCANHHAVAQYLGIPSAQPPVGQRRWRPPQPIVEKYFGGTLKAFAPGAQCPQVPNPAIPIPQSEDCLFLNVYAPVRASAELLPVRVWVHGGGFTLGSGILYLGCTNANDTDSTALRWVQANIKSFGGDPTKVLLNGQSAGAASSFIQMIVPSSAGLFSAVATESGAGIPLSTLPEAYNFGQIWAARLNCTQTDPAAQLACLDTKNATDTVTATGILQGIDFITWGEPNATAFKPCVDGTLIPMQPSEAIEKGAFNKLLPTLESQYSQAGTADLLLPGENPNIGIAAALVTDAYFLCTHYRIHKALQAAGVPYFAYRYSQIIANPNCSGGPSPHLGASHTFEVPFVFGSEIVPNCAFTKQEQGLATAWQASYASLAATGVPSAGAGAWPRFPAFVELKAPFSLAPVNLTAEYDA
ncbi:Alpha/Beta hydrolase protein, partial [Blyttiomyces helicus]